MEWQLKNYMWFQLSSAEYILGSFNLQQQVNLECAKPECTTN